MVRTLERIREGGCTRCRQLPTYNRSTLNGLAASDREIAADLASRKRGGRGILKAYSNLEELFSDLHAL